MTCRAVVESSPVVGSSRNIILGLVMSSTPIDVLFLYPPLIPFRMALPTLVLAQLVSPSCTIKSSTILAFSYLLTVRRRSQANWKHSLGVRVDSKASSCIT